MSTILKNCQTVFQSSCSILNSYKQCMKVPISPYPCQQLLLSVFFIIAILVSVKWYLIVVLICISLLVCNVEPLFICLLDICLSLEKYLFKSFAHFLIGSFVFLLLSVRVLYIFCIPVPNQIFDLQIGLSSLS